MENKKNETDLSVIKTETETDLSIIKIESEIDLKKNINIIINKNFSDLQIDYIKEFKTQNQNKIYELKDLEAISTILQKSRTLTFKKGDFGIYNVCKKFVDIFENEKKIFLEDIKNAELNVSNKIQKIRAQKLKEQQDLEKEQNEINLIRNTLILLTEKVQNIVSSTNENKENLKTQCATIKGLITKFKNKDNPNIKLFEEEANNLKLIIEQIKETPIENKIDVGNTLLNEIENADNKSVNSKAELTNKLNDTFVSITSISNTQKNEKKLVEDFSFDCEIIDLLQLLKYYIKIVEFDKTESEENKKKDLEKRGYDYKEILNWINLEFKNKVNMNNVFKILLSKNINLDNFNGVKVNIKKTIK